ncbi:hypothetical protein A6M21_14760 [Desulfotomaculum copahuensis]|uniref:Prepilin-type N-terminal cleavage/methylation domain-containing protein n=2 Tax=Desulfotomaculum copahuensis TaxID=1838280 RepID=A0A1B7LBL2_9FIRM|nr:hypothetical protein A6M21_14760 [Desulfotomaculum copahuensis]
MEVVVGAALTILLLGAALQCWQLGVRSWLRQERQIDVQDNLRTALELMSGELRLSKDVTSTGNNELHFWCWNVKSDNWVEVHYYVLENSSLVREQGAAHPPVAAHIKSMAVRYFTSGGSMPVTNPEQVTRVEIVLTGGMTGMEDMTMSTTVQLRLKGSQSETCGS